MFDHTYRATLARVARHVCSGPYAAPAWTLWALSHWWTTASTTAANDAVAHALTVDPKYRLALLLQQVLATCSAPPGWARMH